LSAREAVPGRWEIRLLRLSRWRPVCPECGYSLRGLVKPRCPECGTAMPTDSRVFRRWAVQRLPWDRARRGGIFVSYLHTLLWIWFWPWGAGWRVVLPDRWGRALRWASLNVLMVSAAGALLGNGLYFTRWFVYTIWPDPLRHPHYFMFEPAPFDRVAAWLAQSMAAWVVVLVTLPLLGSFLSMVGWRRHLAAKWTGVKWSLYCSAALWIPMVAYYLVFLFFVPLALLPVQRVSVSVEVILDNPPPDIPVWLLALAYGLWWALGLAANPYSRTRAQPMWGLYVVSIGTLIVLAFIAAWFVLAWLLFPAGPLGDLL